MLPDDIADKINSLRQEIARHEYLYRIKNSPEISDDDFDLLMRQLRALEEKYPEAAADPSPSKKVGSDLSESFKSVKHLAPMLSLDNVFNTAELREFDERLRKILRIETQLAYSVEPKIDGAGVSAVYVDGKLDRLLTRGDGETGDDITRNAFAIKNLPRALKGEKIPKLLEIRGEAYMTRAEFDRLSNIAIEAEIKKAQKKSAAPLSETQIAQIRQSRPYANPRNLAAGSLKLLDKSALAGRNLEVVFYSVGAQEGLELRQQSMLPERLRALGLPAVNWHALAEGVDGAFEKICELEQIRNDFPFNTDGAVVKLDNCALHAAAGFTSHAPRWATAWKYRAEQKNTQILSITLQVGRTGAVTPVAELRPVYIAGSTVSRATLHNANYIRQKDIRVSDTVVIEKAGEIIPAVIRVETSLRPANSEPFQFPALCPECGSPLKFFGEKLLARCPNFSCPPQVRGRIQHFASRDCMDIKGLGESAVNLLVEKAGIASPADLYALTKRGLLNAGIENFKDKKADNLIAAIKDSKTRPLWRLIFGLGILEIGERYAKELAAKFGTLDALMNASVAQIQTIDGLGGKSAGAAAQSVRAFSVAAFFEDPHNREMIERLRAAGLNFAQEKPSAGALGGAVFALTGTLKSMGRSEAKAKIEALGGRTASSVTAQTTYLVSGGEMAGAKMSKARQLGTKIISEDEFLQMLKQTESAQPAAAAPTAPTAPATPAGENAQGAPNETPKEKPAQMSFDF